FGLLSPRIYLPARLTETEQAHILAHEQTHLRRGDHWIKAIGWLAVCLHWFNPLVWLTFVLMEKDMELSCDELATRTYTPQQKKEYSLTLVELAAPRRALGACPLAFGESNIAARVKSLLDPRKPALWLTAAAVVTVVVLCATLGSDPVTNSGNEPPVASSAVASSAASQPQSKAQGTALYRDFFLGAFNGQLRHCTKGAVLDWNAYIDALSDAGFTVYEHDGIFEVVDPEAPDWVLSGSQGNSRLDENLVIVVQLNYLAPGEKLWTEPAVSAYCVNLNAPVFTLDYNPRAPQMSTEVRTVEEVEAYFDAAFAERVQQTGTALYRDFFLGVLHGRLLECVDIEHATLDWDAYSAALSDAGYTVHEEEGVFDVFDPETPDWYLCGSLANNPDDETKVVVAHLCYLNPGEKMWYEAGAEVYCMDLSAPVFTVDFNPLSSQMPTYVKTVEELEAYFDTAFAEHGLQTIAPIPLNGRYLRPAWNYFDGCGIRFAVNEEWISPEQDTQDPQQFPFVRGARTLFTYLYTPVKYAPEPLTAEDVSRFYQDQKHEIRGLTEYSIAGHTGTKLVLHLPEQDRVLLQYTVTVPDCLWYTDADGSVARMVDVTQTFLFECTYAQWPETEAIADRVVTSAQLNTTLKPEQQMTDPAFVPYASAVTDAA
ncbi:MAG: M56 family metallopeptidase, partial [Oscillospiraceae bacterium]|nr:M56 family metallopeptidase [Oscillospiraceae bacterium]